jgi:hypothetical protein
MEKEFVPYEQSLALKELGFDEPCLGLFYFNAVNGEPQFLIEERGSQYSVNKGYAGGVLAPIYRQSFSWFREKHSIFAYVGRCAGIRDESYFVDIYTVSTNLGIYDDDQEQVIFNTHEEAELECLKKLIEIVKQKV